MPLHELLPLDSQRMPMIKGPFTFIVTSRGCPAGCKFCIKHVSYQNSVRVRSPEKIFEELQRLSDLGIHHVHMYADLFTVNRDQVVGLCELIIEFGPQGQLDLQQPGGLCGRGDVAADGAGRLLVHLLGDRERQRADPQAGAQRLSQGAGASRRSHGPSAAGIKNWGYFIIGLPGETEETIRETIAYAKRLPLDLCLFHIAAPYPGTPFFFEVVENNWFRPGTRLGRGGHGRVHSPGLSRPAAERLEYWQRRATREWSLRPGPMLTLIKGMNSWEGFKSALSVGFQTLKFMRGGKS